uniref:Rod shape-determining protein MreD n=1 Tax=candidate division WOR-3 bacterium TaxID=2052148 RepID=A0A7C1NNM9_UNCW3
MRRLFTIMILYCSFIIQTAILLGGPDLSLLILITLALYEDKVTSTLAGFLIGFCFDLIVPYKLGVNMFSLSIIGYFVNIMRSFFYRSFWQPIVFALVGILIKNSFLLINGMPLSLSSLLITALLTLSFSLPVERTMYKLFFQNK